MTRLPGRDLGQAYQSLSPEAKITGLPEFKLCLQYQRTGGEQVPGEKKELALSLVVQSAASASQINGPPAKSLKNSTTIHWHLPVTRLTQKLNLRKSYAARENSNR